MSVDVDAWGQNVAIYRTDAVAPLILGYVAVFATTYDCNRIIFPATIAVNSNQSYSIAMNATCNQIILAPPV